MSFRYLRSHKHIRTQTPVHPAPVNPRSPAAALWHFCVAPPSSRSTRRQQDKSMIDSDKPPNNLAHWFLSDKTVSFIPRHHMSKTLGCFLPAGPPPHLSQTQRSTSTRKHRPIYHVFCLFLLFWILFSHYSKIIRTLHKVWFLMIHIWIQIWQTVNLEFESRLIHSWV